MGDILWKIRSQSVKIYTVFFQSAERGGYLAGLLSAIFGHIREWPDMIIIL